MRTADICYCYCGMQLGPYLHWKRQSLLFGSTVHVELTQKCQFLTSADERNFSVWDMYTAPGKCRAISAGNMDAQSIPGKIGPQKPAH